MDHVNLSLYTTLSGWKHESVRKEKAIPKAEVNRGFGEGKWENFDIESESKEVYLEGKSEPEAASEALEIDGAFEEAERLLCWDDVLFRGESYAVEQWERPFG